MGNFIVSILNYLIKGLGAILSIIFSILPPSPFQLLNNSVIADYLPYINYFVPISEAIVILQVWLTAVGIYYIYQVGLRWIKAIE
jgi:polyferredoxin